MNLNSIVEFYGQPLVINVIWLHWYMVMGITIVMLIITGTGSLKFVIFHALH